MVIFASVLAILTVMPGFVKPQGHQPVSLCLSASRLYPDLEDCRKFIRCVNRKPVTFSCPPRTTFDSEAQTCIWRSDLSDCAQEQIRRSGLSNSQKNSSTGKEQTGKSLIADIWGRSKQHSTGSYNISPSPVTISNFRDINETNTNTEKRNNFESNISNSASKGELRFDNMNKINEVKMESQIRAEKPTLVLPVINNDKLLVYTDNPNSYQTMTEDTTSFKSLAQSIDSSEDKGILNQIQQQGELNIQDSIQVPDVGTGPDARNMKVNSPNLEVTTDSESNSEVGSHILARTNISNINPFVTSEDDDVKVLNVLKVNVSFDKTSTIDNDIFNNLADSSEKSIESASAAQDSGLDEDTSKSNDVKGRDNRNIDSQMGIQKLDKQDSNLYLNNSETTANNSENDEEDDRVNDEKKDQVFNNQIVNIDQEILSPHLVLENGNSSQEPVSLQDNTQSEVSYIPTGHEQSNVLDVEANNAPPTQLSTHRDNANNADITLITDNTKILPESESLSIRKIAGNDVLAQSKNNEVILQLYSPEVLPDEPFYNNSFATDKINGSTSNSDLLVPEALSSDRLNYTETFMGESNRTRPAQVSDFPTETGNVQPFSSLKPQGQTSKFDLTITPISTTSANPTDTDEFEGVTEIYAVSTPPSVTSQSITEPKLNASFLSVPYMVTGLVRPFRCPKQHGHFIDPRNCSVYYHCSGGQAYRRDCPFGQVFHLDALSCVSSTLAPPCPESDQPNEDEAAVERVYQCKHDGHFRDTKHCNVYYICASGSSMRMTCDPGTSFNVALNLCMWDTEVNDCKESHVDIPHATRENSKNSKKIEKDLLKTDVTTIEDNLNQKDYGCPEKEGVFPDANNCSWYFVCHDGLAKRMLCPPGTGYDVIVGLCSESAHLNRCMPSNGQDDTWHDTVPNLQIATFSCPEAHGLYPDPNNCSAFIHCFKKVPYRHMCQPGTAFSSEIGVCTWRELVPECQRTDIKSGLEETHQLSAGASQSQKWSPDMSPEPYKQQVTYGESSEPDIIGQSVAEIPDFVCPDVADGFFRDNLFCDIFHRCVLRTRFTFTCPTGTFFRLSGNMCDFWETVPDCTQDGLRLDALSSLPEIAQIPVTQPVLDEFDLSNNVNLDADPTPCPESSGLFPHPRNCLQFLFCAQFVPLVLTCPESLLYNPQTLTCDLAKNVQCMRYDDYAKK